MKKTVKKQNMINILCEFTDNKLERAYIQKEMDRAIKHIGLIALALGILYVIFAIPDYFLVKNFHTYLGILINRMGFLLLVVMFFCMIKKIKNHNTLLKLITLYEIIGMTSYLVIMYQYENPEYLIQAFGIIVIILGIYTIPNRWVNMVVVSAMSIFTFFITTLRVFKHIEMAQFVAGIAYVLIIFILCCISSFRANYLKRIQFYDTNELLKMSITDALTGIYNRGKFDADFKYWVDYSKRYNIPLSLVIFDFDEFKSINDKYGHLVGDDVIVQSVNLISNSIRQTDIFARWGGEEFVLLLTNTDNKMAIEITERIRRMIAEHKFETAGVVTCSFGVVTLKENDYPTTLLNRADQRLYFAKALGKNRVAC